MSCVVLQFPQGNIFVITPFKGDGKFGRGWSVGLFVLVYLTAQIIVIVLI